jgi:LysM repeat protein
VNELVHKVEKGQGLYAISRIYGVAVSQLIAWNHLENESIKTGQTLVIKQGIGQGIVAVHRQPEPKPEPELKPDQPSLKFYRVQKGDTIYSITKKYAISAQDLIKKNNLKSKVLKPGQKLIIS